MQHACGVVVFFLDLLFWILAIIMWHSSAKIIQLKEFKGLYMQNIYANLMLKKEKCIFLHDTDISWQCNPKLLWKYS